MYALRPLQPKDVSGMLEWMKDPAINRSFRFDASKQTAESVIAFIEHSMTDKNKHFAVIDETDTYLGTISLKEIDHENRTAEYAISLRASAQGKGTAAWATRAILDQAFTTLGLNRVYLNVFIENTRAQLLYEKAGFQYEGTFRQALFVNNEWKDLKLYAILKQNFLL